MIILDCKTLPGSYDIFGNHKLISIIVATHSDRLIRFLKPKEVVVMDIDDSGFATAQWPDSLDLEQWLADYSLDEIWRIGRMGGRA